jgi:hypothetical protein
VLIELEHWQEKSDVLILCIAESGDRGSQAALSRLLEIKPQSLPRRITAARNRIAARQAG